MHPKIVLDTARDWQLCEFCGQDIGPEDPVCFLHRAEHSGEMTQRAHAVGHEWIIDRELDVCLRPMLFDEEGKREVRYRPDPGEYRPLAEALEKLQALEARQEVPGTPASAQRHYPFHPACWPNRTML